MAGLFKHISIRKNKVSDLLGFSMEKITFLDHGIDFLEALKKHGAHFSRAGDHLQIQIKGNLFQVNSWEELFILNEVFVESVYDIDLAGNYAVIDIGMNVGMASLHFASGNNCEKVFSFEPFANTIDKAMVNYALNPHSNKISIFNTGLGFPDREVTSLYSEEFKGSVGICENPHVKNAKDSSPVDWRVKDVAAVFKEIYDAYKGTLVVKIDCEGAEYEIMERLDATSLIQRVSAFIIEWHMQGQEMLNSVLLRNGYYILNRPSERSDRGMIYGFKMK